MTILGFKDYLNLIWKDPVSRRQFQIGTLSKNGGFEFEYGLEIEEAIEHGFKLMPAFPDKNKKYSRKTLFPAFSCRLPDRKRPEIDSILRKYGMEEYDEYELLKRSGARTPSDSFEFINPIFDPDENTIIRTFRIAGVRHCAKCEGKNCEKLDIKIGDSLRLKLDTDNEHDQYAIKVLNQSGDEIGYIPRYYAEQVSKCLKNGYKYKLSVVFINVKINEYKNCSDCIFSELILEK